MSLLERSFHLAHYIFPEGGSCLEFGVFRGGTFAYQADQINKHYPKSRLIGFDSWQGLPEETPGIWIPERHAKGEYAAPKDEVLRKLAEANLSIDDPRLRLVDGFYSDSLTPEVRSSIDSLIFVNIDVDIYSSTIELLDFIEPLLRPGVILYWDDWKDPRDSHDKPWGEHAAWDDWRAKHPGIEVATVGTNEYLQQVMVVTAVNGATLASPLPSLADIEKKAADLERNPPELRKREASETALISTKIWINSIPVIGPAIRRMYRALR